MREYGLPYLLMASETPSSKSDETIEHDDQQQQQQSSQHRGGRVPCDAARGTASPQERSAHEKRIQAAFLQCLRRAYPEESQQLQRPRGVARWWAQTTLCNATLTKALMA